MNYIIIVIISIESCIYLASIAINSNLDLLACDLDRDCSKCVTLGYVTFRDVSRNSLTCYHLSFDSNSCYNFKIDFNPFMLRVLSTRLFSVTDTSRNLEFSFSSHLCHNVANS